MQSRVQHGVRPEVVALMDIPQVGSRRARLLWQAGLRSAEQIAATPIPRIAEALSKGTIACSPPKLASQEHNDSLPPSH